jgi:two-component system cell cycle sensor histidine kinase/response regulator CckA
VAGSPQRFATLRAALLPYFGAVLLVACATLLRWLLVPRLGDALPFITYFPAVVVAAWRLGLGPTLLTLALSAVLADYLFLTPEHGLTDPFSALGLGLFVVIGAAIATLGESQRRAAAALAARADEMLALRRAAEQATAVAEEAAVRAEEEASRAEEECLRAEEERGRATAALDQVEAANRRLTAVLESMSDAFAALDRDWRITYLNREAARIAKRPLEDLVGKNIWELFPPLLETAIPAHYERALTDQLPVHFEEYFPPFGIWLEMSAYPSADGLGIFFRDVTARRQAAQTSARLAAIVESSDDAIVGKSLDGVITSWNAAAERIFGYTAGEMVGAPIFRLIPPELQAEEHAILQRIARGEHVAHYETTRMRKDGSRIPVELTVSPVRDAAGTIIGASSIKRDIGGRRRMEEQLRQAAKMEAIGRLAGGLAHDFNNQLYAVSGFAAMVGRDPGLGPQAREDLLQVQKAAGQMATLTRQLLAFSRQQVLTPETLDLGAAVADTQPMLQRLVGRNVELRLQLATEPTWVRVDRAQLSQVLLNLSINARDAMPDGGPVVIRTGLRHVQAGELDDRVRAYVHPGDYAELVVVDSGIGIAAEHLPRIFEPFFTTKATGRGTGLGLATVHGVVAQSQGHAWAESTVGRGTTVTVLFPLAAEPAPRPADSGSRPGAAGAATILVVDDEETVRALVVRTLGAEGYRTLEARHGREALERLRSAGGAVDLVLSDVVMPEMAGAEFAVHLAREHPGVPLVWMSGFPREAAFEERWGWGDRPFLLKPITRETLLEVVHDAIRHRAGAGVGDR